MTHASSGSRARRKRLEVALVSLMAVLAWASVAFWQHEGRTADAAARKDAAAHGAYRDAQGKSGAAQARLAQARQVIDSVVPNIDRDADITELGNSLGDLHADVSTQIAFYARMIDALGRGDLATYNALVGPLAATVAPSAMHAEKEARLHDQLGLKFCDGCSL